MLSDRLCHYARPWPSSRSGLLQSQQPDHCQLPDRGQPFERPQTAQRSIALRASRPWSTARSPTTAAVRREPAYGPQDSTVAIVNSILWNDISAEIQIQGDATVSVAHSNVAGGWSGIGNVDAQPLFARPGYWATVDDPNVPVDPGNAEAVWIDGDYHLQSQAGRWDPLGQLWLQDDMTCPCIDTGDPNSPPDNEPAPNGGAINLGTYGGTGQASRSQ